MSKHTCHECGEEWTGMLRNDPRFPQISELPCLCASCFDWICEDEINDMRYQIAELEERQILARQEHLAKNAA